MMKARMFLNSAGALCLLAALFLFLGRTTQAAPAATCSWNGSAGDSNWATPGNWTGCTGGGVPASSDLVVLDNSIVAASYGVNLPTSSTTITITRLTITPGGGNTITLTLPSGNTANPGLSVGDNTSATDDIIINSGGVLKNSSGAASGTGVAVFGTGNGTFRINNGGRYIHNTTIGNSGIVGRLSTASGTETGIFEFDVPGVSSYIVSASGQNYGSLTLTRTGGPATYTSSGGGALTVRGNLTINLGVTYNSTMTGALNLSGNLTNHGTLSATSQLVNLMGSSLQTIGGASATTFSSLTISNALGVNLNSNGTVTGTLTLTAGDLNTGANTLTMGSGATTISTANDVVGQVVRNSPGTSLLTYGSQWTVIQFTSGAPTSMAITLTKPILPFQGAVQREYTLTVPNGSPSFNAIVQLHLDASNSTELNGNAVSSLNLFRFSGTTWLNQNADLRSTQVGVPGTSASSWVSKTGVTTFSPWGLASANSPTAVTLSQFTARIGENKVTLNWTTGSEVNTAGFNLYRAESKDGPYTRINAQLIPAANSVAGSPYEYQDTSTSRGRAYYYQLEDVELNGRSARHGPITVGALEADTWAGSGPIAIGLGIGVIALIAVGSFVLLKRRNVL